LSTISLYGARDAVSSPNAPIRMLNDGNFPHASRPQNRRTGEGSPDERGRMTLRFANHHGMPRLSARPGACAGKG
jgi:hypothetical protein